MPQMGSMSSRRAFLGQVAGLALVGGAVWWARENLDFGPTSAVSVEGGDATPWLKFATDRGRLVTIPVTLNGVAVTALVDSGAQHSIVDRRLAERLQLKPALGPRTTVIGAGGGSQVAGMATADVGLGGLDGLSLPGLRVALLDLGYIGAKAGLGAPVLLGHDVLSVLVADFDFPRRRVRFHRPEAHTLPPDAVAMPTRNQDRALLVQVEVEDKAVEVVVDTGASPALSLSTPTAEELGLLDGRRLRVGQSVVLGGVATGRVLTAESFALAGRRREDVDVYVFEPQRIPGFPKGLLGYEALRRFRVILDCGKGTMHLLPGG